MQTSMAGIEDMELFERHGVPVEEKTFADVEKAAAEDYRCAETWGRGI